MQNETDQPAGVALTEGLGPDAECKQATPYKELMAQLLDPNAPKSEREHAAVREIERLQKIATAARPSVKKDLNWYERYVLVKKGLSEPHGAYEAEAQRLFDLLESIDGILGPNVEVTGLRREE